MGPFEMVLGIVLISVGAGVINNYLRMRKLGSKELQELRDHVSELTARVQNLETIVTDSQYDLKHSIDRAARTG